MTGDSPSSESAVRRRVLVSAFVASGLVPLNSTMIAVGLRTISSDFSVAPATVTPWLVTGYLIATLVCQTPAGSVADRIGYTRALAVGRWTFALGALVAAMAPVFAVVVAGRLAMAIGGSLLVPTAMALVRRAVPEERRPRAFGMVAAVLVISFALGPVLGAVLTTHFGWRALFLVNFPLLVVSALVEPKGEAAPARPSPARFDWAGSVLLAVALVAFLAATRVNGAAKTLAAALVSATTLVAFTLWERRAAEPIVDLDLFRRGAFVGGASVISLQNLATYGLLFLIPFLARSGVRSGQSRVALVMMSITLVTAAVSPLAGRLAERIGSRAVVVTGALLCSAGMAGAALATPVADLVDMIGQLLLVAAGVGLSTGPSNSAALGTMTQEKVGAAAAVVTMFRYLGSVVGTALLGFTLGGSTDDASARHRVTLWLFAGAFALSGGAGALLPGKPPSASAARSAQPGA